VYGRPRAATVMLLRIRSCLRRFAHLQAATILAESVWSRAHGRGPTLTYGRRARRRLRLVTRAITQQPNRTVCEHQRVSLRLSRSVRCPPVRISSSPSVRPSVLRRKDVLSASATHLGDDVGGRIERIAAGSDLMGVSSVLRSRPTTVNCRHARARDAVRPIGVCIKTNRHSLSTALSSG
jgi:hypothetical protein